MICKKLQIHLQIFAFLTFATWADLSGELYNRLGKNGVSGTRMRYSVQIFLFL